jgi:hypothetical protein
VNAANARIYGSDYDAIFLAPLGTPLPTGIDDALNGAFEDVGWLHTDGVTETFGGSKTKIRGHQGGAVVRGRIEEGSTEYAFVALESKTQTQALRYDERTVTTASGVRSVTRGPGQKVSLRAAVIEFYDADNATLKERIVIPRFEVVADGDRVFVNNDIAAFPFRGEIIGTYSHYSNVVVLDATWDVAVTGTPTGGSYTLLVNGYATAPIAYNANAAAVAAAINAISGVTGITGVTASGTNPISITFPSTVGLSVTAALTGGTSPTATVTP